MKKQIKVVALFVMITMIVGLSACSSSGGTGENVPSQEASSSAKATNNGEAVVLKAIIGQGGLLVAMQAAMDSYTKETGTKFEIVSPTYQEMHEKQVLELATGSNSIDFVMIDGAIWMTEQHNYLEPLKSYIEKDKYDTDLFIPAYLDMSKYQDTIYALPFRVGGWVLIYRSDLFKEKALEVPKTMEDFRKAAISLTKGDLYGFVAPLKQTNYLVAQWCPFLYSWGGEFLSSDESAAAFNSKAGIESLQFFVNLFVKDKVISPAALDYEHDGVVAALQQGSAAMAITYSPYYLNVNDAKASKYAGKFSVSALIPGVNGTQGKTEISGWGIGINKASQNKDTAWDFIKYCGSDEVQTRLASENNNSPVKKSTFKSSQYLDVFPDANAILTALEGAKYRPGIAKWSSVEDTLARELSAAFSKTKTVEQALADAEKQVNSLLK